MELQAEPAKQLLLKLSVAVRLPLKLSVAARYLPKQEPLRQQMKRLLFSRMETRLRQI